MNVFLNTAIMSQQYTFEDFVKCRYQKEWICDNCMKCGDINCCSGHRMMFRVPKTDVCLCSICLDGTIK
jgi:hypothetical protein